VIEEVRTWVVRRMVAGGRVGGGKGGGQNVKR